MSLERGAQDGGMQGGGKRVIGDQTAVCEGQPARSSRACIRIKWNYIKMDFNGFGFYSAGETKLSEVFELN